MLRKAFMEEFELRCFCLNAKTLWQQSPVTRATLQDVFH